MAETIDLTGGPIMAYHVAVTDVRLEPDHDMRHRFVRDTLREAGIQTLDMNAFATWVPKLKAQLNGS